MAATYPQRIICLTEETTETLYLLGAQDRIVGVSGYTVRPPEARKKPRVSAFINANFDKIMALKPDLVIGFSDLQADIARELIKRGVPVMVFNQRSVPEILQSIRMTGALVGLAAQAEALAERLERELPKPNLPSRPRVFFEEWNEPLISAIRWVSELIEIAGGEDVCAETRDQQGAAGRIFAPADIIARQPDVIIASWCGRKVSKAQIMARPGWNGIPAVRNGHIYEIKSTYILQPGPASLTEGVAQLARIIEEVSTA